MHTCTIHYVVGYWLRNKKSTSYLAFWFQLLLQTPTTKATERSRQSRAWKSSQICDDLCESMWVHRVSMAKPEAMGKMTLKEVDVRDKRVRHWRVLEGSAAGRFSSPVQYVFLGSKMTLLCETLQYFASLQQSAMRRCWSGLTSMCPRISVKLTSSLTLRPYLYDSSSSGISICCRTRMIRVSSRILSASTGSPGQKLDHKLNRKG